MKTMLGGFSISTAILRILFVIPLAASLWAQNSISTVNTDPIWNANVFWTNPPVLAGDVNLVEQVVTSQATCYAGSSSSSDNCYYSAMSGNFTILNESASQSFTGLVLQPTFSSAVSGVNGSIGNITFTSDPNALTTQVPSAAAGSSAGIYSTADPGYVLLRMSDYFAGVSCGASANQSNCVLAPGQTVAVPFSFVGLPASVIFSVSAVGTDQTIYDTTSNNSTSAILAALASGGRSNSNQSSVPEPSALLLMASGILAVFTSRKLRRA